MADNVKVVYSGDWVFYQGAVASGATLAVVNAGGIDTDYADIFTDADLTVASSNPITADSSGLLAFAYIGTTAYKVILKTSTGVTIKTEDNIPGAVSSVISANVAIPIEEVNELTADTTLGTANIGQTLNCTPSSTFTVTLGSAVTIGDGKGFRIVHSGTANQVKIVTSSGQTIVRSNKSITAFALVGFGHSVKLISDGANWIVVSEAHPGPVSGCKVIPVTDQVSAAPSSPTPGAFYIVSAAYSTFATGDLIEADGQGGFTVHTPPTDCGWIAYVQDENLYYRFIDSAWASEAATDSAPGTQINAINSEMEAASSPFRTVTPGRQHRHPAHPKVWLIATVSSGTPTLADSYNMTSITDSGTGILDVTIATDFSSANWCPQVSVGSPTVAEAATYASLAAGTIRLISQRSSTESASDPTSWAMVGLGDQ